MLRTQGAVHQAHRPELSALAARLPRPPFQPHPAARKEDTNSRGPEERLG